MEKHLRIIILLGIVEAIILTMVGLYFYRFAGVDALGGRDVLLATSSDTDLAQEASGQDGVRCLRAGCGGQLCVGKDEAGRTVTTCEYRPEYGCYAQAACAVQADGSCGFSDREGIESCIARVRSGDPRGVPIVPEPM